MLHGSLVMQVKVAGKLGVVYQLHRGSTPEGVTLHATTSRQDTVQIRQGPCEIVCDAHIVVSVQSAAPIVINLHKLCVDPFLTG